MIRRWIKNIILECVECRFDRNFEVLSEDIGNLRDKVDELKKIKSKEFDSNFKRLEIMTNELKGAVSMTRASLIECKDLDEKINVAFAKQFIQFKDKYFVITAIQKSLENMERILEEELVSKKKDKQCKNTKK